MTNENATKLTAFLSSVGTTETDRTEDSRLLAGVHAGVRVAWRCVRLFGASEEATARHTRIPVAKVREYLTRGDRALEALGEVPGHVVARMLARLPGSYVEAMRHRIR